MPEPTRLEWGYSLSNVRELLLGCLDVAGVKSVLEIGAYRGELTTHLLDWAKPSGAKVAAIDPLPLPDVLELVAARPELELIEQTSEQVLGDLDRLPDAIVLDGDHNHHTLSNELGLIGKRAQSAWPLMLFHDVYWPHARRDTYYVPERIPEDRRQPLAHNTRLEPGNPGTSERGLPFEWAAEREGGPRNGTMSAIEEFLELHPRLRFARLPAFFGFGVMWDGEASYAPALESRLSVLDENPVLERLESNRVDLLIAAQASILELQHLRERAAEQERILRRIEASSAFSLAERLSRLRHRGEPAFSRGEIRAALDSAEPRE